MSDEKQCLFCENYVPEGRDVCPTCETLAERVYADSAIPTVDRLYSFCERAPWYVKLASLVIRQWLAAQGKKLA